MKELFQDKKRLLLAGGAVLLIVIAIVLVLVLRGHSRSVQYEHYMDAAEESILSEDYAKAISYLERAFEIKDTDDCAIALAQAYAANGDLTKAEDILLEQIQNCKGDSETRLKQALRELGKEQDAPEENSVTIAGQSYATAASSVTISGTNLSAQDLDALASFENLTTLSLKNCGLKDLDFLEE